MKYIIIVSNFYQDGRGSSIIVDEKVFENIYSARTRMKNIFCDDIVRQYNIDKESYIVSMQNKIADIVTNGDDLYDFLEFKHFYMFNGLKKSIDEIVSDINRKLFCFDDIENSENNCFFYSRISRQYFRYQIRRIIDD